MKKANSEKAIAVIYKSQYGTTRQYAQWIAETLDAPLYEHANIKPSQLREFDTVVYGGGLYAGGIDGVKLVTKGDCKRLVVFTVGLADPKTTDYSKILNKNFSPEKLSEIKIFHLRGGIDYKKLGLVHKGMMATLKKITERTPLDKRIEEDALFLESYGGQLDFMDKSTIVPLIEYVCAV